MAASGVGNTRSEFKTIKIKMGFNRPASDVTKELE
jgi:hypothetical protein